MVKSKYESLITRRWHDHLVGLIDSANNHHDLAAAKKLSDRLSNAIIVEPEELLTSRVQFGCLVTVFSLGEEEEQTFEIVSSDEASIADGLLDQSSALAQALMGAREGDVVHVVVSPTSNADYEVTHIRIPRSN